MDVDHFGKALREGTSRFTLDMVPPGSYDCDMSKSCLFGEATVVASDFFVAPMPELQQPRSVENYVDMAAPSRSVASRDVEPSYMQIT